MTREEVYVQLDKVFQDEFEDESIHVTAETTAEDIEEWDSLEHINLILAVEERFQMKFTIGEVTQMKNVGEMVDLIMERVNR